MQCWFTIWMLSATHLAAAGLSGPAGVQAAADLAFNPLKLIILIIWVYIGLYCVQRVEFSLVVPKDKKANRKHPDSGVWPHTAVGVFGKRYSQDAAAAGKKFFRGDKRPAWDNKRHNKILKAHGRLERKFHKAPRFIRHRA